MLRFPLLLGTKDGLSNFISMEQILKALGHPACIASLCFAFREFHSKKLHSIQFHPKRKQVKRDMATCRVAVTCNSVGRHHKVILKWHEIMPPLHIGLQCMPIARYPLKTHCQPACFGWTSNTTMQFLTGKNKQTL